MKSLIVFCSSHGTTEKAATHLRELLAGDTDLIDLSKNTPPDLQDYEAIIIGGSIHLGYIQRRVKQFIKKNLEVLLTKKVGLFLCCMREGDIARDQFNSAFPKALIDVSLVDGLFGGEFLCSEMNFIERQIVKKVSGTTSDLSKLDTDKIKQFAEQFNIRSYAYAKS